MVDCKYQRSFNEYYQRKCSRKLNKSCKDAMPAKLRCQSSGDTVTINQFEVVTREYLKYNKSKGSRNKDNKTYRLCIFSDDLPRTVQKTCKY